MRIIAAARKDARTLVEAGRLRDDLLSCNAATLMLPPLRDHAEDIPALMDHFFDLGVHEGFPRRRMEPAALDIRMRYRWGNLRELRDLVFRLALLQPDEIISETMIERELVGAPSDDTAATRGHQIAAARLPGISRDTLRKKSLRRII